jgi:hypothetical protein
MSIWLAICLAEPMQLHTCVMHGGLAIDVAGSVNSPSAAAHHAGSSARHGTMAAVSTGAHSHHQHGDDTHARQCSCLGDCSTGKAPIGLAPALTQLALPATHSFSVAFAYESPSVVAAHFLLPFSNGPPDASSRA